MRAGLVCQFCWTVGLFLVAVGGLGFVTFKLLFGRGHPVRGPLWRDQHVGLGFGGMTFRWMALLALPRAALLGAGAGAFLIGV